MVFIVAPSINLVRVMGYPCYVHAEPGGDYEFVDGSIPSRYQCTICMKVLRDARLTECWEL